MDDILTTVESAGTFNILIEAVKSAGLVNLMTHEGEGLILGAKAAPLESVLKKSGPYTVFAPTDEAFAKLPGPSMENLLRDLPALTSLLEYHVVSGEVTTADVTRDLTLQTLNGSSLHVTADGGLTVNGTTHIVRPNIQCTNGVIHAIDEVLLPTVV